MLGFGCGRTAKTTIEQTFENPGPADSALESQILNSRNAGKGNTLFELVPAGDTGIDFVHVWNPPKQWEKELRNSLAGGGVCIGDYDADGLPDVYLSRPFGGNRLYRNLGEFRFTDVTKKARLLDDHTWGSGVTFADIDNDGDLDLFACSHRATNRLYINQGDGTFRESAERCGLAFSGASVMMAFADYDRDGDLDGYLVTNAETPPRPTPGFRPIKKGGRPTVPKEYEELSQFIERADGSYQLIESGFRDHLYQNNGDGTFSDVSQAAGIRGTDMGLSATWWDFDNDGWPDLYVANDFWGSDKLYHNQGDGTFSDVAESALPHTPWFSMGSDVADLNNDGKLDFMASDMSGTNHFKQKVAMGDMEENGWFLETAVPRQYMRNAVFLNTGTSRFMEVANMAGLANTDWTWSIKLSDLDDDGRVDAFVTNGMTRNWFHSDLRTLAAQTEDAIDFWNRQPKMAEANVAYRNLGDMKFENVSQAWGLDDVGVTFGAALGDIDGDGDLDMVTNSFDGPAKVYRNSSSGRRVKIRLRGTSSNAWGCGAMVTLQSGGRTQTRYLTTARGYMSANEPVVHFGLGHDTHIDRLSIQWPSGAIQNFHNLPTDKLHVITECNPASLASGHAQKNAQQRMLTPSSAVRFVRHEEKPYDDFAIQPLLPNKLSQLGPGMAWGDVNGDGNDDLFLTGAAGQSDRLFFNHGSDPLKTQLRVHQWFEEERDAETMAGIFLDVDADGDLDLYAVSGGTECQAKADVLLDRLYLNDGSGNFTNTSDRLPESRESGSCAVAADFDRDGDVDLFVGSRCVPGQYPMVPRSQLLRNDGGIFSDVCEDLAPELKETGLVTSAVWSDVNNDGWIDLLVTHEWGPVKLFQNEQGRLVDRTETAKLAGRTGWWNSITGGDVDRDGDIDFVVGNFGLNTKYHASIDHPTTIYYGDLDGSGKNRIVEAEFEGDTCYPVRGRSCSSRAMPELADRFPRFTDFALASLQDIYTPRRLAEARKVEANTLESSVLINDGSGQFQFTPLPRLAQAAPSFGAALVDIDGDGNLDLCLAQNFYGPQRETGRMDGSVSLLLTGRGDGTFEPIWPDASGFVVPNDGKSLTTTDLDDDGWPDILVGVNNNNLLAFSNTSEKTNSRLSLSLKGETENPTAVGARVTVHLSDGTTQSAEVSAGSGYLSQSSPALLFGLGEHIAQMVEVRWPNGSRTKTNLNGEKRITIDSTGNLLR